MFLSIKPYIITMNERRIHVIRKPGFITWLLLGLSSVTFIAYFEQLLKNFLYLVILILGEIILSLDTFGEWQELLLDREENKATITKCSWYFASDKVNVSMKLTDIRHVGVSVGMGLFFIHRNGQTISLSMHGLNREELQKLRRDIHYFLNMNHLDTSADNNEFLGLAELVSAPNDNSLPNILQTHLPGSVSTKLPTCTNASKNNETRYAIRCKLSLPIITDTMEKKNYRHNLRKSLYTEKIL